MLALNNLLTYQFFISKLKDFMFIYSSINECAT